MRRNSITGRWLVGLMWPGGWVLLAAWAFQQEEIAVSVIAPHAHLFCFSALGAAALLSWYFNYGRVFFVAVATGLTTWVAQPQTEAGGEALKWAAVFLLPVNLALFVWLKEGGVATLKGLIRVGFIVVQVAGVLFMLRAPGPLQAFLQESAKPGLVTLPMAAQLLFAAAALVVLVLVFVRRTKAEQDSWWVLLAVFAGLVHAERAAALFLYFGAAGLILLLGVLERGYHIAYRDELTGLPGRRALNDLFTRLSGRYAIAMCDVDHFKKFNDTYGHDAGDQVLRMVAARLSNVRGGGRVFRYGGEEFAVVFRGRSMKDALPYVEALRAAVAEDRFTLRRPDRPPPKSSGEANGAAPDSVTITISIGVAESTETNVTPERVIDAADAALYRAKQAGRNRVMLDDTPPS